MALLFVTEVLSPSLPAGVASRIEVPYVGKCVTHALPTVTSPKLELLRLV
jgi:hypothetical protein